MWYQINVAQKSPPMHILRTGEGSILNKANAIRLAENLGAIFPDSVYEITVSRVETHLEEVWTNQ